MTAPFIQGRVIGVEAVERRFTVNAPAEVRVRVRAAIRGLGLLLERTVKTTTLAGSVLHKRTGRLTRSVNTKFTERGDNFTSSTGTRLKYGRAWELGFSVPSYEIHPKRGSALMWPGAAHPVRMVRIPARTESARPWLSPPFRAMRPVIRETLRRAMRGL